MSNQSIRVAVLTTSFPLRDDSVSGVFIQRLVKSLPANLSVTVVTPADTAPEKPSAEASYKIDCFRYAPRKWQRLAHQPGGIPVAIKRHKTMRWLVPVFLMAMFVASFRAACRADVIHANWSINGAMAGLIGLLLRKPVVTTVRGEDITRAKNSAAYRNLLTWCLRSNYRLVTVSEAIRDLLLHKYPHYRHKITFLPNGVDEQLLARPALADCDQKAAVFKVVTVGSLIPRKGVDVIIEAFSRLNDRQVFELSVIGSGEEQASLEALVKSKGLKGQVTFVGNVSPDRVPDYLCSANALVLASYSEGRPNVVLESLAAGLPVIASDIEGVQELVRNGKTGLLFRAGDAAGLAAQLEALQQAPERQKAFSRQGREFILENQLLWTNVGQQYAELYQEAIRR